MIVTGGEAKTIPFAEIQNKDKIIHKEFPPLLERILCVWKRYREPCLSSVAQ